MNAPKFTLKDAIAMLDLAVENADGTRVTLHKTRAKEITRALRAPLLSAASELYEALFRIMPFVDDAADVQGLFPESTASKECRDAVQACRTALAKARGETP